MWFWSTYLVVFSLSTFVSGRVDVNDCSLCHVNGECQTSSPGSSTSHYCQCQNGYLGNGTFCEPMTCDNANPCSRNAVCTTIAPTNMRCTCNPGYAGDGRFCLDDVDECSSAGLNDCHDNATCTNGVGSYTCTCNTMFMGNGTHCVAKTCDNANPCGARQACSLNAGAFSCRCIAGFTGINCEDKNECDTNPCPSNLTCLNTYGSYECQCEAGYYINGTICQDLDECSSPALNDCHENATCGNTNGSYSCICNTMFRGNGTYCEDVDECTSSSLNNCHEHATCVNTIGSYDCICNTMYMGNGTFCEAKTCDNANPCGARQTCSVDGGAFSCTCIPGFTGIICEDINECDTNPCSSNANCVNTYGSYECQCDAGFYKSGTICQDLDECSSSSLNNCHEHATCSNTAGSYICTCNTMFRGNGTFCEDVDECDSFPCHPNATCTNTPGSFMCQCDSSYAGNGTFCAKCPDCQDSYGCKLDDNDEAMCYCHDGYKEGDNSCFGFCPGIELTTSYESYIFNETWVGDVRFSNEKCSNGRAKASITCVEVDGQFVFNASTFHEVPCTEALKSLSVKINWEEAVNEELEEGVSQLNIFVSGGANLSTEDRQQFLSIVNTSSTSLLEKTDAVTLQTLREMVVAANSVTESLKASLHNQSSPNTGKNESLVKEGQVLVKALRIFAAKVSLTQEVVTVTTVNIRAEVKTRLSPNNSEYEYQSKSLRISVPREAVEQANEQAGGDERIVFLEYTGNTLFQTTEHVETVVTVELGVNVHIQKLKNKLEYSSENVNSSNLPLAQSQPIPGTTQSLKSHAKCVYYVPENLSFSTEGCCLVRGTTPPVCECDHMTSFAVLVEHETVDDDIALSIVTTIGCVISSTALVITIALHLSDRCNSRVTNKRQKSLTIYMHICVALLGVYLTFLLGVSQTSHEDVCTAISAILHYLLLVTWCWTTVYSYTTYMSLSKLSGESSDKNFMKRSAMFAYGMPLAGVLITVLVNLDEKPENEYEKLYCKEEDSPPPVRKSSIYGYRAKNMCWLTGNSLKFGFLVPAGLMLLVNYVFFTFLVWLLARKRLQIKQHSSRKSATREITAAASMATTLGLTWVFGYLMLVSTDVTYRSVMAWLFSITNVLQGLLLFAFTIARRVELREKIYASMRTRFSSISVGVTSKMRSVRYGKKYVVNNATKLEDTMNDSTTDSTANLDHSRNSVVTRDTTLSESKVDFSVQDDESV